jgi:hypothetical protein
VAIELEEVVRRCDQSPFGPDGGSSSACEAIDAAVELRVGEDGLDDCLALAAWLGPWEHVRGNETDSPGRLKTGRSGFFDEVMRFYDRFLNGVAPAVQDSPMR